MTTCCSQISGRAPRLNLSGWRFRHSPRLVAALARISESPATSERGRRRRHGGAGRQCLGQIGLHRGQVGIASGGAVGHHAVDHIGPVLRRTSVRVDRRKVMAASARALQQGLSFACGWRGRYGRRSFSRSRSRSRSRSSGRRRRRIGTLGVRASGDQRAGGQTVGE